MTVDTVDFDFEWARWVQRSRFIVGNAHGCTGVPDNVTGVFHVVGTCHRMLVQHDLLLIRCFDVEHIQNFAN